MRFAWLTDIHLNFIDDETFDTFVNMTKDLCPDAIAISGDISESQDIHKYLIRLEESFSTPIYFVLGNHDFYGGYVHDVRSSVADLAFASVRLHYLTSQGVLPLTNTTGIIGHDSRSDGRFGNWHSSNVLVDDFFRVNDFQPLEVEEGKIPLLPKWRRLQLMQALAQESAEHFYRVLPMAFESFRSIFLVTHVPPFRESCWYRNKISDDDYLPHFSCKAVGDVLLREMQIRPEKQLIVLCGHTHGSGEAQILDNLLVLTGDATYGSPKIQRILEIE